MSWCSHSRYQLPGSARTSTTLRKGEEDNPVAADQAVCEGASHRPGVPRPTTAKFQTHHTYSAAPAAITTIASHATGLAACPPRVRIHQGSQAPPRPGTTIVNTRLRTARLSARAMVAHLSFPVTPAGPTG